MSTNWEKVLDDFNIRFGNFVLNFLEDLSLSSNLDIYKDTQNLYLLNYERQLYEKEYYLNLGMITIDKNAIQDFFNFPLKRFYNNFDEEIYDLNNSYEYIDSKFMFLTGGSVHPQPYKNISTKLYLILYDKVNQNIVSVGGSIDYIPSSKKHSLYINYNDKSVIYDGNVFFNDKFYEYILPCKNLDIVFFKLNGGFKLSYQKPQSVVNYESYNVLGHEVFIDSEYVSNKNNIIDPYISAFQLIENLGNSMVDEVEQISVENYDETMEKVYNDGFENGYIQGVSNTKKQFRK